MQTDTGYLDGEIILARLEEAQTEGATEFVAAHMPLTLPRFMYQGE